MSDINDILSCANCGKGEEESCNLKYCSACKLVKYCSVLCQKVHRPMHKKECKKRAAELHDIDLFKQPPLREDCPIFMIPLPFLHEGSSHHACCGAQICNGCIHAVVFKTDGEVGCPFCRKGIEDMTNEEWLKDFKKRVELGDDSALYHLGHKYAEGDGDDFPQSWEKALETWHRSAAAGCYGSYTNIAFAYINGNGVEIDMKKAVYYSEKAAMLGDPVSRRNLGIYEEQEKFNDERALKHYMIAAAGGCSKSLNDIHQFYMDDRATKEDYSKALRARQAYVDQIRSDERDESAAYKNSPYY